MNLLIVFTADGSDERTIKVELPKKQSTYQKDDYASLRFELKNIVYNELKKMGENPKKIEIVYAYFRNKSYLCFLANH